MDLSPFLHFESGGEELHKMGVTFQPAMALFQLQVSNLADKSLGALGRDGTRLYIYIWSIDILINNSSLE